MSSSSVVILTGTSPRHAYVANRLCESTNVRAIVQESGSIVSFSKIARMLRPSVAWRKVDRWIRDRKRYLGNREAEFYFGQELPLIARQDLLRRVRHINDPEVAALVSDLAPDVVAVFGTSLIRSPLLGKGRLGMLNLHGGLSPRYRGADCTFWALYNNEPEQVGCTLHFIDEGIDTGDVIAQISPPVRPGDDELSLFWRAVKESAEVYAEAIERLGKGERFGVAQAERGHLYQVKDRTRARERELARANPEGVGANINLPLRVRWFKR